MVLFDTGVLSFLINSDHVLHHPKTGEEIDRMPERIEGLLEHLNNNGHRICLPTPVIAEFLVHWKGSGSTSQLINTLESSSLFELSPFDMKAAIEHAQLHVDTVNENGNKRGSDGGSWAKMKFDRQIISIAKARQVDHLYVADNALLKLAQRCGLQVTHIADLPIGPKQIELISTEDFESTKS